MIQTSYSRDYHLRADHPDFAGHFPGHPVFPAVSQIDLVMGFLEESLGMRLRLRQVRRAKFRSLLLPESRVQLKVTLLSESEAEWLLRDETHIYSSGEVLFLSASSFSPCFIDSSAVI